MAADPRRVASPSGTGHDTERIWTPGQHDQHCAARQGGVCGRFDGCYPPGPASVSPAEPPHCEILPLVIADLTERIAVGTAEYGSALAVESQNDALRYAYEEALDLTLYLRQELERRG